MILCVVKMQNWLSSLNQKRTLCSVQLAVASICAGLKCLWSICRSLSCSCPRRSWSSWWWLPSASTASILPGAEGQALKGRFASPQVHREHSGQEIPSGTISVLWLTYLQQQTSNKSYICWQSSKTHSTFYVGISYPKIWLIIWLEANSLTDHPKNLNNKVEQHTQLNTPR